MKQSFRYFPFFRSSESFANAVEKAAETKIGGALDKALQMLQNTSVRSLVMPWRGIHGVTSRRSSEVDLATAFKAWSAICINKRAVAIAGLQWKVKRRTSQTEAVELPLDYWLVDLFENPNPVYTKYEIFSLIEKWYCSSGNAFIWTPILDKQRFPLQCWVLPSSAVSIVPSSEPGRLLDGYLLQLSGQRQFIPTREMIHLRNLVPDADPISLLVGKSLVQMAADSIQADAELQEYLQRYLQNDGLAPMVGMTDDKFDAGDWKLVKEAITEKMPNLKILGMLERGLKLAPVAATGVSGSGSGATTIIKELDPINKENISASFGLRTAQMTGQNTSYENADANDYSFRVDTIEPHATYFGQVFTKHFRQFDPGIIVEHVPFVRKDAKLELERLKTLGYVPNQERAKDGLPPVPGGDEFLIPSGFTPLKAQLALVSKPEENPGKVVADDNEEAQKRLDNATEAQYVLIDGVQKALPPGKDFYKIWKAKDDLRAKHELFLKRGFLLVMADLKDEIEIKLSKVKKAGNDPELKVEQLFNLEEWIKKAAKATSPEVLILLKAAAKAAAIEAGEKWEEIESDFDKEMKVRLAESTSKISRAPLETIAEELEQVLKDNHGKPAAELKEIILARFDGIYTVSRANVIATTTATFALNSAQEMVFSGLGGTRCWLTQRDGKVRVEHRKADGQKEDENKMFTVGGEKLKHPAGGSLPQNNIGCRCYTFLIDE